MIALYPRLHQGKNVPTEKLQLAAYNVKRQATQVVNQMGKVERSGFDTISASIGMPANVSANVPATIPSSGPYLSHTMVATAARNAERVSRFDHLSLPRQKCVMTISPEPMVQPSGNQKDFFAKMLVVSIKTFRTSHINHEAMGPGGSFLRATRHAYRTSMNAPMMPPQNAKSMFKPHLLP